MRYKTSALLGAALTLMHSSLMWHMMPSSRQPYTMTAAKNGLVYHWRKKHGPTFACTSPTNT
eukprot:3846196-Ditylum_brightwellii.AAC.1